MQGFKHFGTARQPAQRPSSPSEVIAMLDTLVFQGGDHNPRQPAKGPAPSSLSEVITMLDNQHRHRYPRSLVR